MACSTEFHNNFPFAAALDYAKKVAIENPDLWIGKLT